MTTSEALKRFRNFFGLSQQKVAESIGISQPAWGQYETKGVSPNSETLIKIAKKFKVTTDYLLGLTDDPRPVNQILEEMTAGKPVAPSTASNVTANNFATQEQIADLQNQIKTLQNRLNLVSDFLKFEDD